MTRTHATPRSPCPECGHGFAWATNVENDAPPKAGDLTICAECRAALAFDEAMNLRMATPQEAGELLARLTAL